MYESKSDKHIVKVRIRKARRRRSEETVISDHQEVMEHFIKEYDKANPEKRKNTQPREFLNWDLSERCRRSVTLTNIDHFNSGPVRSFVFEAYHEV